MFRLNKFIFRKLLLYKQHMVFFMHVYDMIYDMIYDIYDMIYDII